MIIIWPPELTADEKALRDAAAMIIGTDKADILLTNIKDNAYRVGYLDAMELTDEERRA